jgi:hypothetical protein
MAISVNKSKGGNKGPKGTKHLNCKLCGNRVDNVDANADKVTCWKCVSGLCSGRIKITN